MQKAEGRISELKEKKKFQNKAYKDKKTEKKKTEERDVGRRYNIYFNQEPRRKEEKVQKHI